MTFESFFGFYIFILIATSAMVLFLRRVLAPKTGHPIVEPSGPTAIFEWAYATGGSRRVTQVALAALATNGLIYSHKRKWKVAGVDSDNALALSQIEREVLDNVQINQATPSAKKQLISQATLQSLRDAAERNGMIFNNAALRNSRLAGMLLLIPVAIGGMLLAVNSSSNWPVAGTLAMLALSVPVLIGVGVISFPNPLTPQAANIAKDLTNDELANPAIVAFAMQGFSAAKPLLDSSVSSALLETKTVSQYKAFDGKSNNSCAGGGGGCSGGCGGGCGGG